ncbi:MAG TPA: BatD family protein [Candidatus Polarisedimenticolaceae bacterium]
MRRLLALAALAALVVVASARGEERFRVEAGVSPARGATDTTPIELSVRIEGSSIPEVRAPRLPLLQNLEVVSGPSTSSQRSFVFDGAGARQTAALTLTWILRAKGAGPARIPPIELNLEGTALRTKEIRFEVGSGPTGPQGRGSPAPATADDADVFVRASLGTTTAWLGEPISLEAMLYMGVQVVDARWTPPPLSGFWSEEEEVDAQAERRRVEIEGRTYVAQPIDRRVLVPTAAGTQTIEPFTAELAVPARRRTADPFEDFFRPRVQTVVRKTSPVRLQVRPLPEEGKPEGFGGAVGVYAMQVTTDRSEAETNQAIVIRATVEGEGSLQGVAAPRLDFPRDLKVFDPKTEDESKVRDGRLRSRRTWEWVVVPLAPGTLAPVDVRFPYFDFRKGAYAVAQGSTSPLVVRRGSAPEAPFARGEVRAQRNEIAFVRMDGGGFRTDARRWHERPAGRLLFALPLLAAPVLAIWGRRRAIRLGHRATARAMRAGKRARRGLDAAERALGAAGFHAALAGSLLDYVADRSDRSAAGLTHDEVDRWLAARGGDEALRSRVRAVLEASDFARFAPGADDPARRRELLAQAREVLLTLEGLR